MIWILQLQSYTSACTARNPSPPKETSTNTPLLFMPKKRNFIVQNAEKDSPKNAICRAISTLNTEKNRLSAIFLLVKELLVRKQLLKLTFVLNITKLVNIGVKNVSKLILDQVPWRDTCASSTELKILMLKCVNWFLIDELCVNFV